MMFRLWATASFSNRRFSSIAGPPTWLHRATPNSTSWLLHSRILEARIPKDLNWVLRIDGHTDIRPISTSAFRSNWELSSSRAISVVKFLISKGVPPCRLVAAGFGEYQPLSSGGSEGDLRRNRRIELKLTEK